ncbi:MAG: response regulator [bacterium]
MNILVADDDRAFSLMICTVLKEGGHIAVPAFDSIQAFMYAMRQELHMVLLDINMPGGTGIDVLKKLRQSSRTSMIPVVVITGSTDPAVREQAIELGAAAFLSKPIDPDELLRTVNAAAT